MRHKKKFFNQIRRTTKKIKMPFYLVIVLLNGRIIHAAIKKGRADGLADKAFVYLVFTDMTGADVI